MNTQEMNIRVDEGNKPIKAGKKKRKIKRRLFWIKFILLATLFSAMAVLLAMSPLFNIKTVIVHGNVHYTEEELAGSTGIIIGVNGFTQFGKDLGSIFSLRYRKAEAGILGSHPYIKDIRIRFSLPDKVIVTVSEREPFAVVPAGGINLLIDGEGYVLETSENSRTGYPVIVGLEFTSFQPGQALEKDNENRLEKATYILETLERSDSDSDFKLMDKLGYIDVADEKNICLQFDSRILVKLGDLQDLNYKVAFLKEILHKKISPDEKGILDFTTGESPEFIPGE